MVTAELTSKTEIIAVTKVAMSFTLAPEGNEGGSRKATGPSRSKTPRSCASPRHLKPNATSPAPKRHDRYIAI